MGEVNLAEKFAVLAEQVARLEEKIDAQDELAADLVTQIESMRLLLMKIIDEQTISVDLLFDINYSILKRELGIEEKIELGLFTTQVKKDVAAGLPAPSLNEFHYQLMQILKVPDDQLGEYPLEISKRLLADCLHK